MLSSAPSRHHLHRNRPTLRTIILWRAAHVAGGVQAGEARQLRRRLIRDLRPDAISLVDAWAFTNYELNSAIGLQSGDVYSALLEAAQRSPLNRSDEGPAWEPVLKPAVRELQQMRAKL